MLFRAIKVLKNWHMFPIVYFRLTKKSKVIFETKNGLKLVIRTDPRSTDIHVFTEIWLENLYTIPRFEIGIKDVVIDVGAHVGMFSIFASQFCKKGQVYSYEPAKENFNVLNENLSKNRITNVRAYNKAGSSKKGKMRFYLSGDDFAAHSLYSKSEKWIEVETTTLKDIFNDNKLETCNFLKMDCEGAEYDMLMNLPEDYLKKIRKICLEYHNIEDSQYTVTDLAKKLQLANFDVNVKPSSNKIGFLYAIKS